MSREKSIRSNAHKEQHDVALTSYDSNIPIEPVPLNSVPTESDPIRPIEPVPLNSIGPPTADELPSCSTQNDIPSTIDELEKHFIDNIFSMMHKEETFSGQVKLMEWILQMQNSAVLNWYSFEHLSFCQLFLTFSFSLFSYLHGCRFLAKGSVMILAAWLSQAAIEEQTSVLLVILEVLLILCAVSLLFPYILLCLGLIVGE